ncbi:multidrug efflux pump subunit AcrB [Tumebacillus sp. BK434]|uniref:efflux RND transporter permease subunit n=1 Tax=Tumebacillus sp. BK434 TaxID=2512169 RepID=UPI00104C47E9|nr:efflux RND transporter permease subunit [Tumebacillus sp. BK434]TCP52348.1 multidrug efflux pump subunit AcrB [Tumebacillus sp. BK434]
MSGLTKLSLKHTVAVIILCVLVLVGGLFSTNQIKIETFPDVSFPALMVQGIYPGEAASDVEAEVTKPLETSLLNVKGHDSITSSSSENASIIMIMYPFGTDMEKMSSKVEEAVGKIALPDRADVKVIRMTGNSMPVYQVAVSGDNATELQGLLEKSVMPELKQVDGVASASLKGTQSTDLQVVVDQAKAQAMGLSLSKIKEAIQAKKYSLPLGNVETEGNSIPVRLTGDLNTVEELKKLQLSSGQSAAQAPSAAGGGMSHMMPDGSQMAGQMPSAGATAQNAQAPAAKPVLLQDVATISEVTTQSEITRYNGQPSMTIEVLKSQDANTAEVVTEVKDVLQKWQDQHSGLTYHVIFDQGAEVEKSVSALVREGLLGALFTVIVILLFLRSIRATLISILSLPLSILGTIFVLNQFGYTLNIMTLGGLAVAVGRIVDDSIVVIENIYRWRQKKGTELSGKALAYQAAREVTGAVASSTFATVVVFAPLAIVSGIIGEFFRPFAVAVVTSILLSLLVSLVLIPVLGSSFFKKIKLSHKEGKITQGFEKLLRGSLRKKGLVLSLTVVLLIGSLSMIPVLGVSFLPQGEGKQFSATMKLPNGTSLERTDEVSKEVESYLKKLNGVEYSQMTITSGTTLDFNNIGATPNVAKFTVHLEADASLENTMATTQKELTSLVQQLEHDAEITVQESQTHAGPPSGNNVTIQLFGDDLTALGKAATQVEDVLKQNENLKDVTNNMNEQRPKWVVTLNQKGEDAGVSGYVLMGAVSEQLRPVEVGTYQLGGNTWNLTLKYDKAITTKDQLAAVKLPTAAGIVSLGDIANIAVEETPVSIPHKNGKPYADLAATIKGNDTAKVTQDVIADLDMMTLPAGVTYETGGGMEMITKGFSDLGMAMVAAVFLVFLILSVTFGGLKTPLVILSSLLFVPIGALGMLLITGEPLSMSGMIGLLMLIGIVVTNAVVLLDRVEKNRDTGMELTEAVVEAAKTRLRPIVMTALATIFALLPLSLSQEEAGLISKGLALTVIGGLTTSTFLTLLFVPVLYSMVSKKRKPREKF